MNAPEITEADVVAFLKAKASELTIKTGRTYVALICEVRPERNEGVVQWQSYVDGGNYQSAPTADGAIAKSAAQIHPENAADVENLRAQAAQLIAAAEAMQARITS